MRKSPIDFSDEVLVGVGLGDDECCAPPFDAVAGVRESEGIPPVVAARRNDMDYKGFHIKVS